MDIQVVIKVTEQGQLQVIWPKERPLLVLDMLDTASKAIKAEATQKESTGAGGVVEVPAAVLNRLAGNGRG